MIIFQGNDVIVRDSEAGDVPRMKDRMRPAEISEVWASHHFSPFQALSKSWENSTGKMTFLYRGEIGGMFGVAPESLLSDRALAWLLTTDTIYQMRISFLRLSKKLIDVMLGRYGHLYNYVDARNIECLNWLEWMGAKIYPPEIMGVDNMPFHYIVFGEK